MNSGAVFPDPMDVEVSALKKAIERSRALLEQVDNVDYDQVHALKSILYAAIEQAGTRVERLSNMQRMLRELFAIVNVRADMRLYEKEVGLQIVEELTTRFGV